MLHLTVTVHIMVGTVTTWKSLVLGPMCRVLRSSSRWNSGLRLILVLISCGLWGIFVIISWIRPDPKPVHRFIIAKLDLSFLFWMLVREKLFQSVLCVLVSYPFLFWIAKFEFIRVLGSITRLCFFNNNGDIYVFICGCSGLILWWWRWTLFLVEGDTILLVHVCCL